MVLPTFGKLSSVLTPSPPTAGPQEKGPALKSINIHLAVYTQHSVNNTQLNDAVLEFIQCLYLFAPIHVSVRHSA